MRSARLAAVTGLLIGIVGAADSGGAQGRPAQGAAVIVRARFVTADGKPVTNKFCFADNVDAKGGPGMRAGQNGVVVNPQAALGANGQLELQIPESFLSKTRTLTIFCALNPTGGPSVVQARTIDGRTANLAYRLGPTEREVDLGRVQVSAGNATSEVINKD